MLEVYEGVRLLPTVTNDERGCGSKDAVNGARILQGRGLVSVRTARTRRLGSNESGDTDERS